MMYFGVENKKPLGRGGSGGGGHIFHQVFGGQMYSVGFCFH